jgi:hypothetical protein
MTQHEEEQAAARRRKHERRKAAGLIPPTKLERLEAAMLPMAKLGATSDQIRELVFASMCAFRQGSSISFAEFEDALDKIHQTVKG